MYDVLQATRGRAPCQKFMAALEAQGALTVMCWAAGQGSGACGAVSAV